MHDEPTRRLVQFRAKPNGQNAVGCAQSRGFILGWMAVSDVSGSIRQPERGGGFAICNYLQLAISERPSAHIRLFDVRFQGPIGMRCFDQRLGQIHLQRYVAEEDGLLKIQWWDSPTMTVKADSKRRVVLPLAEPGDLFEVQLCGQGKLTLTKLEPVQGRTTPVTFRKRGRYTVGFSDRPVSEEAIREAVADYP